MERCLLRSSHHRKLTSQVWSFLRFGNIIKHLCYLMMNLVIITFILYPCFCSSMKRLIGGVLIADIKQSAVSCWGSVCQLQLLLSSVHHHDFGLKKCLFQSEEGRGGAECFHRPVSDRWIITLHMQPVSLCPVHFYLSVSFLRTEARPTARTALILANYANDTLMRCNSEFIKQQG